MNEVISRVLETHQRKFSIHQAGPSRVKIELFGKLDSRLRLKLFEAGKIDTSSIRWCRENGRTQFIIKIWQ